MALPIWLPNLADVTKHIPTRGPFDETSDPTAGQITALIASVTQSLQLEIGAGTALSEIQEAVARSYVEYAVASRVEQGLAPEQQDPTGVSRQLDLWAGAELARLRISLGLSQPGSASAAPGSSWSGSLSMGGR